MSGIEHGWVALGELLWTVARWDWWSGFNLLLSLSVALPVVLVVHEVAHLVAGSLCGVRTKRLTMGHGPALGSVTVFGTEWVLHAIPFHGEVNFHDEFVEDGADDPMGSFRQAEVWKRCLIALAGPGANLATAVVCLALNHALGHPVGFIHPYHGRIDQLLSVLALVSVVMAAINLVPLGGTDGDNLVFNLRTGRAMTRQEMDDRIGRHFWPRLASFLAAMVLLVAGIALADSGF